MLIEHNKSLEILEGEDSLSLSLSLSLSCFVFWYKYYNILFYNIMLFPRYYSVSDTKRFKS